MNTLNLQKTRLQSLYFVETVHLISDSSKAVCHALYFVVSLLHLY